MHDDTGSYRMDPPPIRRCKATCAVWIGVLVWSDRPGSRDGRWRGTQDDSQDLRGVPGRVRHYRRDPCAGALQGWGADPRAVCAVGREYALHSGVCPEGYSEIGHSNVPSRCGAKDGGLMSQCQSTQMGSSMPDPNQGGMKCPPDCGSTAAPGQGAAPPPPKFRPSPEHKSQ